jgi:hypothetical protein
MELITAELKRPICYAYGLDFNANAYFYIVTKKYAHLDMYELLHLLNSRHGLMVYINAYFASFMNKHNTVTCCRKARMLEWIDQARFPRNSRISGQQQNSSRLYITETPLEQ